MPTASSLLSLSENSLLDKVKLHAQGAAALKLRNYFSNIAEELVHELLTDAVESWSASSFDRYDDAERACTARLFSCILTATHRDPEKYAFVTVCVDGLQPTQQMLAGVADILRAPRPDFTVNIAGKELRLEAKVLRRKRRWAKAYIVEGMQRFWDGRYGSPGIPGIMIGYVQEGTTEEMESQINSVLKEMYLPSTEWLIFKYFAGPRVRLSESHHERVRLLHHLIQFE